MICNNIIILTIINIRIFNFFQQKSPVRETVLSKQYMIKLVNADELNNIKEILKAETSIQKAQAYIAELQDNVVKARNVLSADAEVIDLVDEKSDASVKTKKRKMPNRSSKDKAQNYAGDKSESENDDDLIPYKIPRKNELKETKIEKNYDEVSLSCLNIILCYFHVI